MPGRRRGKFQPVAPENYDDDELPSYPEPYRFIYDRNGYVFNRDAYHTIMTALQAQPYPPRLFA
jgi:hypothetical protein